MRFSTAPINNESILPNYMCLMVKLEVTRISFGPTLKPSHFACVRLSKTAILADDPLWLHSIDITDIPLSTYIYIYITYIYIYITYIYVYYIYIYCIYIYICILYIYIDDVQQLWVSNFSIYFRHAKKIHTIGLQATLSTAAPHLWVRWRLWGSGLQQSCFRIAKLVALSELTRIYIDLW